MNNKITVCIPTYNAVECLDLCIKSCLKTQDNCNEIVCVIDGTQNIMQSIIDKYKDIVKFVISPQNRDICTSMNIAASIAASHRLLFVNDDHVFSPHWDTRANKYYDFDSVVSFLTLEPRKSTWKYTITADFGSSPQDFKFDDFCNWKNDIVFDAADKGCCQVPFMINKYKYLAVGGWDPEFIHGERGDCDFFLKTRIMGMHACFSTDVYFYHFSSQTMNDKTLTTEKKMSRTSSCVYGERYSAFKWGKPIMSYNGKRYLFTPNINDDQEFLK